MTSQGDGNNKKSQRRLVVNDAGVFLDGVAVNDAVLIERTPGAVRLVREIVLSPRDVDIDVNVEVSEEG